MAMTSAEKCRRWRERNPEKYRESQKRHNAKRDNAKRAREWRAANNEKRLAYNAENRERHAQQAEKRRVAIRQGTPLWADVAEIATIYEAVRSMGLEVDHIVPLLSDRVCGLHVTANLQPLTPEENRRKRNAWWPDMFEETSDL